MKKKHIQACDLDGSIYGKKRLYKKKVSPNHKSMNKKDLMKVYNKFYRDQVSALYKAIHHTD